MTALASTDVTYTVKNLRRLGNSKVHNRVQIAFGDSALTYAAGGVPLLKGKLGCPNTIESLIVVEQSTNGYQYQYVGSTEKLVIIAGGSHTHDLFLRDNTVGNDTSTNKIGAVTNKIGANAGANITIAGIAAASGNGGIVANVAGQGGELSGAPAATTLICEVIGW